MRIGVVCQQGDEMAWARRADALGIALVMIRPTEIGSAAVIAGAVAACTSHVRIVVDTVLGDVHPLAAAETLAVLDNLSGGRVIGAVRPADGHDPAGIAEDVVLLRSALRPGAVRHQGERWQVPAGLEGHDAPHTVEVTPKPVQPVLPLWWDGQGPTVHGLPRVATAPEDVDASATSAPARASHRGDVEHDRVEVQRWAAAGTTELLLAPADGSALAVLDEIARYLAPEVAMPHFPRIIAESPLPAAWPGE